MDLALVLGWGGETVLTWRDQVTFSSLRAPVCEFSVECTYILWR